MFPAEIAKNYNIKGCQSSTCRIRVSKAMLTSKDDSMSIQKTIKPVQIIIFKYF